ncbi:hypothetical protein LVD17_18680 [Fulvivirga ulvae]|uniref:hypothetical protein n=1 Tax=Fulvivirga ulvae TaxID=2904245 RepID=UPI001F1D051B|nr:hypothetical protein [Fulvivirga ulvae]UII30321.1 hypothetical protein LVD17_18680 [Fulvivirga ulvae]
MTGNTFLTVKLLKLYCYRQEENDGDEVYMRYNDQRLWPKKEKYCKMDKGEVTINAKIKNIKNNEVLSIELWDYDVISRDDKLGLFTMLVDEKGGPFRTDMLADNEHGAKYSLEWEVS